MKKILLIACLLVFNVQAQDSQGFKALNLSNDQKASFKALRESRPDPKAEQEAINTARSSFNQALKNPKSTDDEILTKARQLADVSRMQNEQRLNYLLKVRKILDEKQFAKFLNSQNKSKKK